MRRPLALAVLVVSAVATVACDPCAAAMAVHTQRCDNGDESSCAWRDEHIDDNGTVLACGV
jgi:hypothetical protein